MEKEQKEKQKTTRTKKNLADKALDRYYELLDMQKTIKKELSPLRRYLQEMGKLEKPPKKKK